MLSREHMGEIPDLVLRYTTNPKASGGEACQILLATSSNALWTFVPSDTATV